MTVKSEIINAFNKHAKGYEQAAKVQNEIGQRLFDRLAYLKINPRFILDLGCGTGLFSQLLKKHYPQAQIIGVDIAQAMLFEAKKKQSWRRKWPLVNADMINMPFAAGVFDLVFANQVLHWGHPLQTVLNELNRVMNVNGCLMFTTLGPDTFRELKNAWHEINQFAHTNEFMDMHDLGDALMTERFVDPVVDMEMLTVQFQSLPALLNSLKQQGVRNINPNRNKGLTGKAAWSRFEKAFMNLKLNEKYPLTYEVVYGHAWKGEARQVGKGTETVIAIDSLRGSLAKPK